MIWAIKANQNLSVGTAKRRTKQPIVLREQLSNIARRVPCKKKKKACFIKIATNLFSTLFPENGEPFFTEKCFGAVSR